MPRIPEQNTNLLDLARAYQIEYDGLRHSRAIAAYLKSLDTFTKRPYDPLTVDARHPDDKLWMRLASRQHAGNQHFYRHFSDHLARMPKSNGSAYYAADKRPRVGIITDEFMFDYYDGPLDLTYLYPETYQEAIDEGALDFVLYVTCWHGRHDQVDFYYGNDPEGHARISAVLSAARKAGLPIVFQSIEDPPSYHAYLDLARQADWVFTSCAEKVPAYRKDLGHDRAHACKFGVNPELNNPVGIGMRSRLGNEHLRNSVLFAGSWYDEYPERGADTRLIFDALIEAGRNLVVFDRRWPVDWAGVFPQEYWYYLLPGINHQQLQGVTKLFDYAVNLNTVKDSTTMCAMRTYELQAAGVLGIANDARALQEQFPELPRVQKPSDVEEFFSDRTIERTFKEQCDGIRRIMSGHLVYDRLNTMFAQMGMDFSYAVKKTALLAEEDDTAALAMAEGIASIVEGATAMTTRQAAETTRHDFSFALKLTSQQPVSAEFVQDAVNAFKYTDVACVASCRPDAVERFDFGTTDDIAADCAVLHNLACISLHDLAAGNKPEGAAFFVPAWPSSAQ